MNTQTNNSTIIHTDVMIDLETLSLANNAAILSIGAVTFKPVDNVDNTYYARIGKSYYTGIQKFDISKDTIDWWNKQTLEAREEAFYGNIDLPSALHTFSKFCNQFKSVRVWGNAASFDLKILEHVYKVFNIPVPWKYTNEMCYRTLKNLFPAIPQPKPKFAHNALSDAATQAEHAALLLSLLER